MKTLIILIISVSLLASCKKHLEEKPYSSLAPTNVFSSEDGLKKATEGIYLAVSIDPFVTYQTWIMAEVGQRYNTFGQFSASFIDNFQKFALTPSEGSVATEWRHFYRVIARANSVIDNATKAVTPDKANTYIAEAKFLRGYSYFMLVRWFGDIPIVNSSVSSLSQTDLVYGARKPVAEVYDSIISDLQFAEANLPDFWTGADIGRISAGVAKAGLGKVYLTMAGKPLEKTEYFQKAADKLNELVGAGETKYDLQLLDDFTENFSLTNERNKEVMLSFGHVFNAVTDDGSLIPFFFGPNGLNGVSQVCIGYTADMYNLYEETDTRRDFTLPYRYKSTVEGDSIVYDPAYPGYWDITADAPYALQRSGIGYGKYGREPLPALPWGYQSDLIFIRFSDVLLMLAEALIESGNTTDGLTHLNRVRTRAHATPIDQTADLRKAVRTERLLELTGEFTTVFDIRRWGTLQEEISAMSPDQVINKDLSPYQAKFELYPIPQNEIDANPNLTQTSGW